jgi:DNA polymerase III subunit beta
MKIKIAVKELTRVLDQVLGVIPSKVTIPVFSYFKIEISGATGIASGTDLGMSIITTFKIEESDQPSGSMLLPAKLTQNFVSRLKTDSVTLSTDGASVRLRAGKGFDALIPGIPSEQFPVIESAPPGKFVLNLASLKKLIEQVESAAPSKESRFAIPVIQLESNETRLRAVATDGFRIGIADAAGNNGVFELQLPKTVLSNLKALKGDTVKFSESETNLFFVAEGTHLLVRKSPAKFPAYKRAIEGVYTTEAVLTVDSLKACVDQITPALDPDPHVSRGAYVSTTGEEIEIVVATKISSASDSVAAKITGEPAQAKLNPDFIGDFLGQATGDVKVEFLNARRPVRFSNGDNYQHFIMPVVDVAPEEAAK